MTKFLRATKAAGQLADEVIAYTAYVIGARTMEHTNGKSVLTTGQVARICHVAPRTVSKWFDTGQLRGYRIPGSRDRRIPVEHLEAFMRTHGIPLDALDGGLCRVLIVGGDPEEARTIAQVMTDLGRHDVRIAVNDFDAGMQANRFRPHVIVMDVDAGIREAVEACHKIRATASMQSARIIAAGSILNPQQKKSLVREGFDECLSKPYTVDRLVKAVEKATNLIT